jgi:hypothetical protein
MTEDQFRTLFFSALQAASDPPPMVQSVPGENPENSISNVLASTKTSNYSPPPAEIKAWMDRIKAELLTKRFAVLQRCGDKIEWPTFPPTTQ